MTQKKDEYHLPRWPKGDHEHDTGASVKKFSAMSPEDAVWITSLVDYADPKWSRADAIRELAKLVTGSTRRAKAETIDAALANYIVNHWSSEQATGPAQNASQIRQAIWRLAKLTDGRSLSWRTIINDLEKPDLSAAKTYERVKVGASHWRPPAELREEEETLSVAVAQPHRKPVYDAAGNLVADSRSELLGTVLGRFCAKLKKPERERLLQAGRRYGEILREERRARGLDVPGWAPATGYTPLTDEERKEWKERSERSRLEANAVIIGVDHTKGLSVARRVCYDELEIPSGDHSVLFDVLVALARFFETTPKDEMREI